MVLYPRRDVVHVAVSPSLGCGAAHTRPVTRGAPDPDWALICPPCERALINDPQWSGTKHEIPETPDEISKRESHDKLKDRSLEQITALALQKIANDGLLGSQQQAVQPLLCKSGHSNLPSSRFCGECGTPLTGEPPDKIQTVVIPAAVREEEDTVIKRGKLLINPSNEELARLPVSELREIAKRRGIDSAQSKKSLVAALSG